MSHEKTLTAWMQAAARRHVAVVLLETDDEDVPLNVSLQLKEGLASLSPREDATGSQSSVIGAHVRFNEQLIGHVAVGEVRLPHALAIDPDDILEQVIRVVDNHLHPLPQRQALGPFEEERRLCGIIATEIREQMQREGVSLTQLAIQVQRSESCLRRLLEGDFNVDARLLLQIATALNSRIELHMVPRRGSRDYPAVKSDRGMK